MGHRWLFVAAAGGSACPVLAARIWCSTATTGVATATSMLWISGAAAFDMLWRFLPDALVALAGLTILTATAAHPLGSLAALPDVGLGAATWTIPLLIVHLVSPSALGFGDVKAAAVVGGTLGLTLSMSAVALALVVATGMAASMGIVTARRTVALGPHFVAGALVVLLPSVFSGAPPW